MHSSVIVATASLRPVLKLNPLCIECGEKATDVDHKVSLKDGGDKLNFDNLRSFCHRHHSQRTGRDQVKWNRK